MINLCADFAETLAERMANPTEEDASKDTPALLHDDGAPVVKVTVSGVDEVTKKLVEDAREAMKEARRDHSKAVRVTTSYMLYNMACYKLQSPLNLHGFHL